MSKQEYQQYASKYQTINGQVPSSGSKLSVKSSRKVHKNTIADIQSGKGFPKWSDYAAEGADSGSLLKVVVIGESGAGKSNLIHRLAEDRFDSRSKSTIGIDFALYEFTEPPGLGRTSKQQHGPPPLYKAQIWDTAGQERYRSSMTKIFYRDVAGALLVFDLTNRDHYFALNRWLDEIRSNVHNSADNPNPCLAPHLIPIVLVGNKVDQTDCHRAISSTEGVEFARRHRLVEYVETSAKTAVNVEKAFTSLFRNILLQRMAEAEEEATTAAANGGKGKFKTKSRRSVTRERSIKLGYTNGAYQGGHQQSPPKAKKKSSKCSC